MFTKFKSFHHVYLIITTKKHKTKQESQKYLFVTKESALLAMETKFHLVEDSGQRFTQIIPYPAEVTLPKLGNLT